MTLHDLFLILRFRWRVVAASTLLALFVVAVVNLALPKQYRASATVVVDIKGGDPVAGNNAQSQLIPGYLATQVGVVASDRVIQKVIQSLALDRDERLRARWRNEADGVDLSGLSGLITRLTGFIDSMITGREASHAPQNDDAQGVDSFESWLTARLAGKLQVRPASEGNLIEITMIWEDAARAAQIANAFASSYIDTNLELKVEPAKQYVKWFEERNQALRRDLERAQARLSEYQREKGVVASAGASLDIENARLSELSSQLTALQGARADSASRARQAASQRDSLTEVLQNPVVASLKGDLARLELRRAETSRRFGDNYPDIQRLDDQISGARERLNREINRVASSLSTSNQINLQRESEIRKQLEMQRQRVLQMTRQRDEIAVLQSDVANAQRAHDTVTQRLAQTSLESQNQMTNVAIITPAVRPLFPDSPRVKVNMLLALVFGSLFGVALALFRERIDQRLYGVDHLRHVLGAPVFGMLGRQGMALGKAKSGRLLAKW
jgi:chain length determinant protein EpsF